MARTLGNNCGDTSKKKEEEGEAGEEVEAKAEATVAAAIKIE